ncbi:MAG: regulatory protein [Solirubrobacteraceae bacterium]|nr:regulatory protein [Solirubrobacteraceae bacterium]
MREVELHLEGRGIEPDTVRAAVAALEADRYLDDARYARRFAEDRRALDRWGSERIEQALRERGVEREHVAAALAALAEGDGESELESAVALLRRRFPAALEDLRARDRALGVLVRKGYELELAHDALRAHDRALAES